MKVLHICNDYFGGEFYSQIFEEMKRTGIKNAILVFARKDQIKLHKIEVSLKNSTDLIVVPLNFSFSVLGRLFPTIRNVYIWRVLKKRAIKIDFDLIHAHTVYSNGSLAYFIHNRINIPYVVSVRNTDINSVLKYFVYQKEFVKKIITGSSKIFSPAPSYSSKLNMKLFGNSSENSLFSFDAIPNPLNEFWILNIGSPKRITNKSHLNVLFVGEIAENKNIPFIIKTFSNWTYRNIKFSVRIIGKLKQSRKGLEYYESFRKMLHGYPDVEFIRDVSDKMIMKEYYRSADLFFMVSKHETFGLVYIEAMSQGTPVLYTKGEGIDGYFSESEIGYPVEYNNINSAREKVLLILNNYTMISENCISRAKEFSKEQVVKRHIINYRKCIKRTIQ
jgi:glycosyltransferase involved in cell wall biosynthesis